MKRYLLKPALAVLLLLVILELLLQAGAALTWWHYRHDDLPASHASTVRILCLGDSNTYGIYLPRDASWPAQLQALLDRQAPGRYEVINLGMPGTPAFRILENLPDLVAHTQPDRIILLAGVNDLFFGSIDATHETPAGQHLYRLAISQLRLLRLFNLWQARRHLPSIGSDSDRTQRALETFGTLSPDAASAVLAGLYEPYLRHSNITLAQEGTDYWLVHGTHRVHLNPLARQMQAATSTYERYRLYGSPLRELMAMAPDTLHLVHDDRVHLDGKDFSLAPEAVTGQGNRALLMQKNIAGIAALARQEHIPLLLLGYASGEHFYGHANRLLRTVAQQEGIDFIDMEALLTPHCPTPECDALFFPDYHPNADGYRLVAGHIARHLLAGRQP